MVDECDALLQAVEAAPDDTTLQLVYADWLDERGDPRGELLRCQAARNQLTPADPEYTALLEHEARLRRDHPAVILPWERRLSIARIRALITHSGPSTDGAVTGPYTPGPCLTGPDVVAWEVARGVALPEEYKLFLQAIGNGGVMPGSHCDFDIFPLARVRSGPIAAAPFPVTSDRFRKRLRQVRAEGRPTDWVLFPELQPVWEQNDGLPGSVSIGGYPGGDGLLLVTTGELRGSIWCTVCYGIPETDPLDEPLGFLNWFVATLAGFQSGA
ncbi:TIGR02996 domain-containing protein [Gemmata sp. JC673]|uniref:TIGR02996 domain-containing protein n=1 Tax=Gemmata algarum TaxID=2975278 RepID=A0ABU5EYK2_9BACT|nr:TIGR02996 domain-containing protein [Gemmata algarum]MDY3559692.1 TIGR02996 domain-containing protein [Gemmata algarum]